MGFTEAKRIGALKGDCVKTVATTDENGNAVTKSIVKGARLRLYPAGMRIFRVSRGVKRPVIIKCTEGDAMEIIGDAALTFERTIAIKNEEDILSQINYRHYNRLGQPKKEKFSARTSNNSTKINFKELPADYDCPF
jgi:hypothetical protein